MERKYFVALIVAIAVGIVAGKVIQSKRTVFIKDGPALKDPTWSLAQGIDEAADYLSRENNDKGRFVYRMKADGKTIAPKQYNVVRHAGAIYALADYEASATNAETRERAAATAERAARELATHYVRPLKANPDLFAVWSDPKEEGGKTMQAKLGGSGLGMIGLLGRYRAADGGADTASQLAVAQGLARFVVFMQKPDGNYVSKYTDESGKASDFESLYYPGEATLGLTMLYEIDHNPQWLDTAMKGVSQLVTSRRGSNKLPPDHWLMIAIDRLLPFYGDAKNPTVTKDEIIDHAIALAKPMIDGQTKVSEARAEIDGCFTQDGRTTPTATRLEGLLALEHALTGDAARSAQRQEVRASIVKGIKFLRRAQIESGPAKGGLPGAVASAVESPADEADDDKDHPDEIRIDYVQHAMSAMMRYTKMCAADPVGCP